MTEHYTSGELFIDGAYYCDTLERPVSSSSDPAIPPGTYNVQMFPSAKHRALRPILIGVQGRSGILIHEGSMVRQTQGSILVGHNIGRGRLADSKDKMTPLARWVKDSLKRDIDVLITIEQ